LYARKDGVNMITAVHIKIAEIAFNRLRWYIMEQQL
jgi:hypothetical protein